MFCTNIFYAAVVVVRYFQQRACNFLCWLAVCILATNKLPHLFGSTRRKHIFYMTVSLRKTTYNWISITRRCFETIYLNCVQSVCVRTFHTSIHYHPHPAMKKTAMNYWIFIVIIFKLTEIFSGAVRLYFLYRVLCFWGDKLRA